MKIVSIKLFELKYQYEKDLIVSDALATSTARQGLLLKINTDDGYYGIGEAWGYGNPTRIQRAIIEDQLTPMLIGEDPTKIEYLFQKMYWRTIAHGRRGIVMGAISGIDIALWDLLGKIAGLPVYKLLGGHNPKVSSYACGGFYANSKGVDGLRKEIQGWIDKGYQAFKIKVGRNNDNPALPIRYVANRNNAVSLDEDLTRVELLREMVGDKTIIVDFNASWDTATMKRAAKRLEAAQVNVIEEPYQFEDNNAYQELRTICPSAQIMGFETEQNEFNFSKIIDNNEVDILEPDIGWCGGFSTVKKIAYEAEAHFKPVSMHSFGSAIHFAASLQMAAALSNTFPIESETNFNPLRSDIMKVPFKIDKKMNFYASENPGLGIEIDWNKVATYQVK